MHSTPCRHRYRLLTIAIVLGASTLVSPEPAFAGPMLYTGSIEIQLSSWSGCTPGVCINDFGAGYSFPFGANISYPSLNNLPSGNSASVSGSGPAAVAIGSNHVTLQTSLYDTSPPTSWNVTFASTRFAGGHAAGNIFGGGAPGSTSSFTLASVPYGRLGARFSGAPAKFGGTLHLIGAWKARYSTIQPSTSPSFELPLSPIGGSFAGTAKAQRTYPGGTVVTHTVWGFPWTTGKVVASAPEPSGFGDYSFPYTYRSATGSDQRTPQGAGNIQLVTPFVVRHRESGNPLGFYHQAGVAILSLRFAPEPSTGLQLVAGLAALAGLYRHSRRREYGARRTK
jgi:hypothetical protein